MIYTSDIAQIHARLNELHDYLDRIGEDHGAGLTREIIELVEMLE